MNFIKVISNLFGTKSDRDMKLIQPLVNEVIKIYPEIKGLLSGQNLLFLPIPCPLWFLRLHDF